MSTDPFHPDLEGVARWLPRSPVNRHTLPVIRFLSGLSGRSTAKDVRVEIVGPSTVRLHRPPGPGPSPALLWIHGGGYVIGTAAQEHPPGPPLPRNPGHRGAPGDLRAGPQ